MQHWFHVTRPARPSYTRAHQLTKLPGGIDSTIYGTSRRATHSFRVHHAAAIAHATVLADAAVLARAASRVSVALAHTPA